MLTFILYILPLFGTIILSWFYAKFVDRDNTIKIIPRLGRWILNIVAFIPIGGWFTFSFWLYWYCESNTKFTENKITDFFIKN